MKKLLLSVVIAITTAALNCPSAFGGQEIERFYMDYVIAVSVPHKAAFRWTVTGLFNSATWDRLWTDLHVPKQRWREWQEAGGRFLILPDMPVMSRLAYIDEGTTSLDPVLLQQDCERALKIAADPDVRIMLRDLQDGAAAAIHSGGIIDIYPRAGELIGNQFSSDRRND